MHGHKFRLGLLIGASLALFSTFVLPPANAAVGTGPAVAVTQVGTAVAVAGQGFAPGVDVTVNATTTNGSGSGKVRSDSGGAFSLRFQPPAGYVGAVSVAAKTTLASVKGAVQYTPPAGAPPSASYSGTTVTAESFGAKGDGATDDGPALQKAFDSLTKGQTLQLSSGKTYAHGGVIKLMTSGVRIAGTGTLLATNEENSSTWIMGDNITVDGPTLKVAKTTKRWVAYEQHELRVAGAGNSIRNVVIDGSAAAGLFVEDASNFLIDGVTVQNTRADGIHMTNGSRDGVVRNSTSKNVGDDGIAVVSYGTDNIVRNIRIEASSVFGQTWGRGISVVGGENITYTNIVVDRSFGAAIYIAAEDSYKTAGAKNVLVNGVKITNANQGFDEVNHGAVLISNQRDPSFASQDVTLSNISITGTAAGAARNVGIEGVNQRVTFKNFTITGGPETTFSNDDKSTVSTIGWTVDGATRPDAKGF